MGYQLTTLYSISPDDKYSYFLFYVGTRFNDTVAQWIDQNFAIIAEALGPNAVIARGLSEEFDRQVIETYKSEVERFLKNYQAVYHLDRANLYPILCVTDRNPSAVTNEDNNIFYLVPLSEVEKESEIREIVEIIIVGIQSKNFDALEKLLARKFGGKSPLNFRRTTNQTLELEPDLDMPTIQHLVSSSTRRLRVFLCHASTDKALVGQLYQQLRADGFSPWLDEEDLLPGQDWQHEIPKVVRDTDIVIVCLSRTSITKRGYIQKEIRYALDVADEQPEGTIFIVPVKLEECEAPERLRRWHWVNLFEERGYEKLMRALHARAMSLDQKKSNPGITTNLSSEQGVSPTMNYSVPPIHRRPSSLSDRTVQGEGTVAEDPVLSTKTSGWKNWGDHPLVVFIGVLAGLTALIVFITGRQTLGELISLTSFFNSPTVISNATPQFPTSTTVIADLTELQSDTSSSRKCVGLDLMFLVDQSGSMIKNDPDNSRIIATRLILEILADNQRFFCPDVIHRVAFISFGSSVTIDISFTNINADPTSGQIELLEQQIQPKNLGNTDFSAAFVAAKQLFVDLPLIPDSSRKQAIILFTDGAPFVEKLDGAQNDNTFDLDTYLKDFSYQVNLDFPYQNDRGTYLWVIAMRDQSGNYLTTVGPFWRSITEEHGGQLIGLNDNNETSVKAVEMLTSIFNAGLHLSDCRSMYIEPYTETLILRFVNNPTDVQIRPHNQAFLLAGQQQNDNRTFGEVFQFKRVGQMESYVISKPIPGLWTFASVDCSKADIFYEYTIANFDLKSTMNVNDPASATFYLVDTKTGNWFVPDPEYPILLRIEISSPSGKVSSQVLGDNERSSEYNSEPLPKSEVGIYRIKVTVETKSSKPKAEPIEIFTREYQYKSILS